MTKTYCKHCGNPTSYELGKKPKFCGECGKPFEKENELSKAVFEIVNKIKREEFEEKETEPQAKIKGCIFALEGAETARKTTFGEVFGKGRTGFSRQGERAAQGKDSIKKWLEETSKTSRAIEID